MSDNPPRPRLQPMGAWLLLLFLLLVALVPTPGGRYDTDWVFQSGLIYALLLLNMGALRSLFRLRPVVALCRRHQSVEVVAGSCASIVVQCLLQASLWWSLPELLTYADEATPALTQVLADAALMGGLVYGLWAMVFRYPEIIARHRLRAIELEKVSLLADQAEMRSRLAPHFLLNTLHTIAAMVDDEPESARQQLATLGDLLRDALSASRGPGRGHSVADEVAQMQRFSTLLLERYRGRVEFEYNVAEDAGLRLVPRWLVQPLIENAVQHGALKVRRAHRPTTVTVQASLDAHETLIIEICNSGPAWTPPKPLPSTDDMRGTGLPLVRSRLRLFDSRAVCTITVQGERTCVCVRIPAQPNRAPH